MGMVADYGDEHIRTLDWKEHIRRRPGMYIGKLGDGTSADDGIYILIKEVLDNSVDEYMMGFGKSIDITIADDKTVTVRDYGRGVPLVRKPNPILNHDYKEYTAMGQEIKNTLTEARQRVRDEAAAAAAPKMAVTCPFCGATTIPDASGRCEYLSLYTHLTLPTNREV